LIHSVPSSTAYPKIRKKYVKSRVKSPFVISPEMTRSAI
jgi:hypothetical protein